MIDSRKCGLYSFYTIPDIELWLTENNSATQQTPINISSHFTTSRPTTGYVFVQIFQKERTLLEHSYNTWISKYLSHRRYGKCVMVCGSMSHGNWNRVMFFVSNPFV